MTGSSPLETIPSLPGTDWLWDRASFPTREFKKRCRLGSHLSTTRAARWSFCGCALWGIQLVQLLLSFLKALDDPVRLWAFTHDEQLVRSFAIEELAEYSLAVEWLRDPGSAKKAARSLLKMFPSRLPLYNAYAVAERVNGNADVAGRSCSRRQAEAWPRVRGQHVPLADVGLDGARGRQQREGHRASLFIYRRAFRSPPSAREKICLSLPPHSSSKPARGSTRVATTNYLRATWPARVSTPSLSVFSSISQHKGGVSPAQQTRGTSRPPWPAFSPSPRSSPPRARGVRRTRVHLAVHIALAVLPHNRG